LFWHGRCVLSEISQKKGGEIMRLKNMASALFLIFLFFGTLLSMACNTVHGMGQDIERGGEKTQDAADSVKRRM
jgi:predicted small secreted protein